MSVLYYCLRTFKSLSTANAYKGRYAKSHASIKNIMDKYHALIPFIYKSVDVWTNPLLLISLNFMLYEASILKALKDKSRLWYANP